MTDLDAFLDALASGDPVPGGGSVAALSLAMGASLLAMVCELTMGRERYASVHDEAAEIHSQAHSMASEARRLMDEDADAYGRVAQAMKRPRSTDEAKAARREAVQSALEQAVEPPLRTMRLAAEAMALSERLAPIGNANAISDVGSAAQSIAAGYHAAELNVEINLAAIKNQKFIESTRDGMPDAGQIDEALARVSALVLEEIRA
jgi:formiminotetrahydrofolate cyclodeaminase